MKRVLTPALCTLAGMAIGGLAVQGLHAQAKPPVYFVAEITVSNPQAYGKEYAPKAQASIKAAGGKIIALGGAGGAGAQSVKGFDGNPPKRVAIQVWDSMDKLAAWYNSPGYQELRKIGAKYATFRSFAVEGRPQ
ncbi:MAG: DUF1330 domain-containing protein [Xanthobacteraceae bacterium]